MPKSITGSRKMNNIFLTGKVVAGKSTVIHKALALLPDVVCGGFRTISAVPISVGVMFDVFIESAWAETPHDSAHLVGTRWGNNRFDAFPEVFDKVGAAIVNSPPSNAALVLMDELGVMESDAELFKKAVMAALNGPLPVLGVIKPKQTPFLNAIRANKNNLVFEVTEQNRDALPFQIAELLQSNLGN